MKTFSAADAQAFDKYAQEKLGIPSLILMENAGRGVAEEAIKFLAGKKGRVAVICGPGNNGGDGFVAARHLLNAGYLVDVYLVGESSKIKPDAATNRQTLLNMGQKINPLNDTPKADLIIDAIFGIGINSDVKEPYLSAIEILNKSHIPIMAVDVPSGLNTDTGEIMGAAMKAKLTVTFVASKQGFFLKDGTQICGKIIVRDIGISC